LDLLLPGAPSSVSLPEDPELEEKHKRTRKKLRDQLRKGDLEDRPVEINVEERASVVGVLGQAGMEMDVEFQNMFEKMLPTRRETRRLTVADARKVLFNQEAEKMLDRDKVHRTAIERVEQSGMVFLD